MKECFESDERCASPAGRAGVALTRWLTTLPALDLSAPGQVLSLQTNRPDGDYGLAGLGLVGALNSGRRWVVGFETRMAHYFIDDWSLSAGYLFKF